MINFVVFFIGKKHAGFTPSNIVGMSPKGELAKCDACGTVDLRAKFKKNKRFCSIMCSKKYESTNLCHTGIVMNYCF